MSFVRCDEDDYDVDIKRDFDKLVAVLKNYERNGSEIPDELAEEKVFKYRDNLLRLREDSKKDSKKVCNYFNLVSRFIHLITRQ